MKMFGKVIYMFVAVVFICSTSANAAKISGKSPSGRAGEQVGIRIFKDGYTLSDLTTENYSDILVYQNQTITGIGGSYSFEAESCGSKKAYIGFADSGEIIEKNISNPTVYFDSDFSDYSGGKGNSAESAYFNYISGNTEAFVPYDIGGAHGTVVKAVKDSGATLFKYIYADPYDMSKKINSGVYRIAFDYCPKESNATFTFRLLRSATTNIENSSELYETFGVNSETKLGFYEGGKGWTMHYPYMLQEAGKWYGIVMYVDFELRRIVYYINGEYFGISALHDDFTTLGGFAFSTPANADVYIDNLSVIGVDGGYAAELLEGEANEPSYEVSPMRTEIKTEKIGNIFGNSDEMRFGIKYAVYDDTKDVTIMFAAENSSGETIWSEERKLGNLVSDRAYSTEVLPDIKKYGLYTLKMTACDSDGNTLADESVTFSFANTTDVQNDKFGIVNHIAHDLGEYDKLIETEKQAGFGMVRDEVFWSSYEMQKGVYKLPYVYDLYTRALAENNMQLLQLFSATNSLYTKEYPPVSDEAVEAFSNYAAHLCKDLKGITNYFEVWNEYNLSMSSAATPANYVKMAKAVAEKVRDVNPNAKLVGVCAGQMSNENKIVPWITEFLDNGGGEYIDVLSIHMYCGRYSPETSEPGTSEYTATIRKVRELLDSHGYRDMPIWMTETGWATAYPEITDTLQAAYGVRANILCDEDNLVEKMFWYTSLKKHTSLPEQPYEYSLGIMQDVMQENPYAATEAYLAFSNFNAAVGEKTQESLEKSENGVYTAKYRDENESVYIIWADGASAITSIDLGFESVEVCDMFGNSETIVTDNGVLTITACDCPQYIKLPEFKYSIQVDGEEIKDLSDIGSRDECTADISAITDRSTADSGRVMVCATYNGSRLIDIKICADKNSDSADFSVFEASMDIAKADRVALFIRDKSLLIPIDSYEIK